MKLHLGCGKRDFGKDWIHIDGGTFPHLHSHDITSLPFDDNTVDLIYASHVIEYFDREEVLPVLREWKRVLKSEGVLRLAVPDFKAMAYAYVREGFPLKYFLGPLYGKMNMGTETIYHKTVYDYSSLQNLFSDLGFVDFRLYDWKKTPPHDSYDDHSRAYVPHDPDAIKTGEFEKGIHTLISLNIEATKP